MTEIAAIHRLTVGESHSVRKTISESDVYLYAGIVGDFHPNHVDAVYAAEHLGKRVAHGALLPGFVSRATVELIGDRLTPPGYAAQEFRLKLLSPVFIGDTIDHPLSRNSQSYCNGDRKTFFTHLFLFSIA